MSCFGNCFGNNKKENSSQIDSVEKKSPDKRKSRLSILSIFKKSETSLSKFNNSQLDDKTHPPKSMSRNSVNQSVIEGQLKYKIWEDSEALSPTRLKGKKDEQKPHWEYKDKIRCMFCGGVNCKHENYLLHKNPAIIGLHSDYITNDIIAAQRPSTVLIKKYDLIKRFKEHNIGLIVNLQREGEHPFCGPNGDLEKQSGFTYDPQQFVTEDIKFRLSGWKDMSVPDSVNFILDIVKDMSVTIKELKSKVLVHCHAGYGRTGVVIACYLLFDSTSDTHDIVKLLRKQRPGCVQKTTQYSFCEKFKKFIQNARVIFTQEKVNIEFFMKNQKDILYGSDLIKYEYIPKLIAVVLEKLSGMIKDKKITKNELYKLMYSSDNWSDRHEDSLHIIKLNINKNLWKSFAELEDPTVIIQLLFDWLEDCVKFIINPEKIDNIFQKHELGELIRKHLEDPRSFSSENRRSVLESLRSSLRSLEIETLNCIALLSSQIKPDNEESRADYKLMMQKLCFHLLGFDISKFNENSKHESVAYFTHYACCLSDIIDFLVIVTEYDIDEDDSMCMNDISPFRINRMMSKNSLNDAPLKRISLFFKNNFKKSSSIADSSGSKALNGQSKNDTSNKTNSTELNEIKEEFIQNNFGAFANIFNLKRGGDKIDNIKLKKDIKPDKDFFREIYSVLDDFYKDKISNNKVITIQSPTKDRFGTFIDHLKKFVSTDQAIGINNQFGEVIELEHRNSLKKESEETNSLINLKMMNDKTFTLKKSNNLDDTSIKNLPILQYLKENVSGYENHTGNVHGINGLNIRKRLTTHIGISKIKLSGENIYDVLRKDNNKKMSLSIVNSKRDDQNDLGDDNLDGKSPNSKNMIDRVLNGNKNYEGYDPNYNINNKKRNNIDNDPFKYEKTLTFDNKLKESVENKQTISKNNDEANTIGVYYK